MTSERLSSATAYNLTNWLIRMLRSTSPDHAGYITVLPELEETDGMLVNDPLTEQVVTRSNLAIRVRNRLTVVSRMMRRAIDIVSGRSVTEVEEITDSSEG